VDFGASTLKVAEFDITADGSLALLNYGSESLGLAGSQDAAREGVVIKALQKLMAERGFASKNINVCAPGFHVFSKFVKLPPVDSGKLNQIIEYEAKQNVPFPLEEVVWDYQILGTTAGGELEVLLVAVKSDIVEGLFRSGDAAGLKVQLVDVSPAALCNAFRFNYGDLEGCTMLLDIGAKTSNLLFFEGEKIYARSINIGANAITQEFAAEAKVPFARADEIKIEEGFVGLGGDYAEPENEHQAAISKIARQVMTRLHIQVNQTLGFYRQQQGGSAPVRFFLSGGGSIMPFTAEFFSEKLSIPVEYFNPFRNIQLDDSMDLEELAKVAHSFGEVVGLALRNLAQCPVEMNLMPKSLLQRQKINQKKPYLIAAVAMLVVAVLGFGFLYSSLAGVKTDALRKIEAQIAPMQAKDGQLTRAISDVEKINGEILQMSAWMREKYYWIHFYNEIHKVLVQAEGQYQQDLGVPVGIWIDKLVTQHPNMNRLTPFETEQEDEGPIYDERFLQRYGLQNQMANQSKKKTKKSAADFILSEADTNSISTVAFVFRAVDVTEAAGDPSANDRIAYGLLEMLKANPLVSTNGTTLGGAINVDTNSGTISFPLNVKLKTPLSL
jgi:type IV pilus assembly protein PilM